MTIRKTKKEPIQVMIEETNRQRKKCDALLKQLYKECPGSFGPIINIKPEENKKYDASISEEDVYRELARINYRALGFPPSFMNDDYLRSVLPLYDSLMPLIKDKGVKELTKNFKRRISEWLEQSISIQKKHREY